MHRPAGPVVEVVALGWATAGERFPDARELARQEPPLPLLHRRLPPRATPPLGAQSWGLPLLSQLVIVRSAGPLAVPVPHVPAAVERVPGLRAVFPVRAVPPAVVAAPGVQMGGKTAHGRIPHAVL